MGDFYGISWLRAGVAWRCVFNFCGIIIPTVESHSSPTATIDSYTTFQLSISDQPLVYVHLLFQSLDLYSTLAATFFHFIQTLAC